MITMIVDFATFKILGLPVFFYFGILTLGSFSFTALIGYTNYHGFAILPFKWHPRFVVISFTIAAVHAILALGLFFS